MFSNGEENENVNLVKTAQTKRKIRNYHRAKTDNMIVTIIYMIQFTYSLIPSINHIATIFLSVI
jgi:hypothetical protein